VATTPLFVTIEADPDQLGPDDTQVADERVERREGEDEKRWDASYDRIADMQRRS
jgi:hypothetical protein